MSKAEARVTAGGVLPLTAAVFSILLVLARGAKHGYAIMKEVSTPAGGSISMGPGTLYGSLDRMLCAGFVEETEVVDHDRPNDDRPNQDRRRYYRITRLGSEVLAAETLRLSRAISAARRKGVLKEART